jgi:hypothetical protein
MSDEAKKGKKPKKTDTKSALPPQSSPQDTSNWDDRVLSTPIGRDVIENTIARKPRSELGENESWGVAPPRKKKPEELKQKNAEPNNEQDP